MRDLPVVARGGIAADLRTPFLVRWKGARIPSIAEELATDLSTVRSRMAGSRRYGLAMVSFELMI